jgi:hypothetical protein
MSPGVLISLIVGAAAVAVVIAPLFRKDAAEAERVAAAVSEGAELQSRKEMLLAALKDLEDDHATSKVADDDYAELHARLTGQAVEVMKRLDVIDERHEAAAAKTRPRRISESKPPGSRA